MAQYGLDQKWTQQVSQTGVGASAAIKIPGWIKDVTALLFPSGTTASVQYTGSDDTAIDGGTAKWITWDAGAVTVDTARSTDGPVTALRINQTVGAGTTTMEIAGQRARP